MLNFNSCTHLLPFSVGDKPHKKGKLKVNVAKFGKAVPFLELRKAKDAP